MSIRDIKRQIRRDLHDRMKIPALYLLPTDPGPWADPVPCGVRLHLQFQAVGALKGQDIAFAQREAETPKAVFQRSEVNEPARNAVISVAVGEAYRIDRALPADDEFVTVHIVPLSAAEAAGLPVP
ncbi:MAG TPA: hypothetical protein VEC60_02975 [Reyranella sp.]|nr:hypothetical protein [Reyranella sp.]